MNDQGVPPVTVQNEMPSKAVENAAKQRKLRKVLDGKTDLYRYFDARGDLIYVGISRGAILRMFQHRETSSWFHEVETIKIDKFRTRKAATREEKRLIKLCTPRHNIVHSATVNRIRRKLIKEYGSIAAWSKQFRRAAGLPPLSSK